jgi:hypothetical protein
MHPPKSPIVYAPVLDWWFAAQWWGEDPEAFEQREGKQQARMVAVYQARRHMDAVLADEQAKKERRRAALGRIGKPRK